MTAGSVYDQAKAQAVEAMCAAGAEHGRRNPVRGCIVTRWVCTCGEETEEFEQHRAGVMLEALLAATRDGNPLVLLAPELARTVLCEWLPHPTTMSAAEILYREGTPDES